MRRQIGVLTPCVIGGLLVLLMALNACGADDTKGPLPSIDHDPSSAVSLTPQQVFVRASESSRAQASYRAEITRLQKVPQDDVFFLNRIVSKGVYQAPDELQVSVDIALEGPTGKTSLQAEQISTGGRSYVKDPDTGEWEVSSKPNVTPLQELVFGQIGIGSKDTNPVGMLT